MTLLFELQERELLAECLAQNPCLRWDLITATYNRAAKSRNLSCRDSTFLYNMLRRSVLPCLQLSRCSRALGLASAAKVKQLHTVLQAEALATDSTTLKALAEHGKIVRRLCKMAEISVLEAMRVLPNAIGSKEWVDNLRMQCEIEAEVSFWRHAFCKRLNISSASMQQVRARLCKDTCMHCIEQGKAFQSCLLL